MTFLKANIASLVATATDFLVTLLLSRGLGADIVAASITGTTTGGVVNFTIGRQWAFTAVNGNISGQAIRYLLVWTGNLLLNTMGIYLLNRQWGVDGIVAKVAVSILVAVGYNYPMQKRFVFRHSSSIIK